MSRVLAGVGHDLRERPAADVRARHSAERHILGHEVSKPTWPLKLNHFTLVLPLVLAHAAVSGPG